MVCISGNLMQHLPILSLESHRLSHPCVTSLVAIDNDFRLYIKMDTMTAPQERRQWCVPSHILFLFTLLQLPLKCINIVSSMHTTGSYYFLITLHPENK